ncbi:hypothetical protein D3C75_1016690 [compost metagenome]
MGIGGRKLNVGRVRMDDCFISRRKYIQRWDAHIFIRVLPIDQAYVIDPYGAFIFLLQNGLFNPHVDFQLDRTYFILGDFALNVFPARPVHANILVQIFHLKGLSVAVPELAEDEMSIVVPVYPHPDFLG